MKILSPSLFLALALVSFPGHAQDTAPATPPAAAGPDWQPYPYALNIEPGSVFDFSALNDAPAGKYGSIEVTPEGHFSFRDRPGTRVRFWGVNLTFTASFLPQAQADQLADNLAHSGYNVVRIHHYDRNLLHPSGPSYEFDPAKLDRLDYFFSALKKRGIYVNIDLFTIRTFSAQELAAFGEPPNPTSGDSMDAFKALVMISDPAFDSFRRFVTNLLTHRNPYTGLTWAQDPALIGICPVNEDVIPSLVEKTPALAQRYAAAFQTWLASPGHAARLGENPAALFNRFLLDTSLRFDAKCADLLHSLGAQALITGSNMMTTETQTVLREKYDYVDNHGYWDHPHFPEKKWSLPAEFQQRNLLTNAAELPRGMMPTRIFGKPFAVSEFNFVWPNTSRSAGGVAMPAYASLQDWDALYDFDYASDAASAISPTRSGFFSLASDPLKLLADRISALLFRRGDIRPAKGAVCFAVDETRSLAGKRGSWAYFPPTFSPVGLVARIGSRTGSPASILASPTSIAAGVTAVVTDAPVDGKNQYQAGSDLLPQLARDGVIPSSSIDALGKKFVSDTGQIALDTQVGSLRVITDRSECFALPPGADGEGITASIKNGAAFGSIFIVSVDGRPLKQSRRLLMMDLTDCLNTGTQFSTADHKKLLAYGQLPHLVRTGTAEVSLHLAAPQKWKAWAVDCTGHRLQEIPLKMAGDRLVFQAGLDGTATGSVAYELSAGSN
jgi:hypothetical protein